MPTFCSNAFRLLFFCFLVTACATLLGRQLVKQFDQTGPDILEKTWAVKAKSSHIFSTESGLLHLSQDLPTSSSLQQTTPFSGAERVLQLTAWIKTHNVTPGEKNWHSARLILIQNNGTKDRFDLPHTAARLDGSNEWHQIKQAFYIDETTRTVKVAAQLNRCTGTLEVKDIRLFEVVQTRAYLWTKRAILTGWGITGALFVFYLFSLSSKFRLLPLFIILSLAAILIGTTIPNRQKIKISRQISHQLNQANSQSGRLVSSENLTKIGHFAFFAVFGSLMVLFTFKESLLTGLFSIFMLACGTELSQLFIDSRTALFADFLIDISGGISGAAIIILYLFVTKKLYLPDSANVQ